MPTKKSADVQLREIFEACVDVSPTEREVLATALAAGNDAVLERALYLLDTHDTLESKVSLDGPPAEQLARAAMYLESTAGHSKHEIDPALVGELEEISEEVGRASVGSRYQLGETVATGGMGEIREAYDAALGRHVAAKVLKGVAVKEPFASLSASQAWRVRRFLTEIELTANLQHPAIPPIYSRGITDEGALLFTMPRFRGRNLAEAIRDTDGSRIDGRNRLLRTLCSVGDALAFAHSEGVIHRDLKPGNVIVGDTGEIYLIDWGLARCFSGQPESGETTRPEIFTGDSSGESTDVPDALGELGAEVEAPATQTARALGTLAYMPPEQSGAIRAASGPASDVYSLGASLVHVLMGKVPLVAHGTLGDAVAGDGHAPEWVAIVRRATALEPEERYGSIEAMVTDMRAAMDHRLVEAHATGPWIAIRKWMRRNRLSSAAIAAFALALVAATGFYIRSLQIERDKTEAHLLSTRRVADCLSAVIIDLNLQKGDKSTIIASDLFGALQERMNENLGHPDDLEAYLRWSSVNSRALLNIYDYAAAESAARRAERAGIENGLEDSENVAIVRSVIANALIGQGDPNDLPEAEALMHASLKAWSRTSGENLEWKFTCLAILAEIERRRGDRAGYRSASQELVEAYRSLIPGTESEAVARANLIQDRLRAHEHAVALGEARELLDYVLSTEWGHEDHTQALVARGQIVSCLVNLQMTDEAVEAARSLVDDSVRLFGADSLAPNTSRRFLAFALVDQDPNNMEEAQQLMNDAAEAFTSASAPNYSAAINTYLLQNQLWSKVGRLEEAHGSNLIALKLAEEHYGPLDSPRVKSVLGVCNTHMERKEFQEADTRLKELLAVVPENRQLVPDWPLVLLNAGKAANGSGDRDRAEAHWQELLNTPGVAEPILAATRANLSQ